MTLNAPLPHFLWPLVQAGLYLKSFSKDLSTRIFRFTLHALCLLAFHSLLATRTPFCVQCSPNSPGKTFRRIPPRKLADVLGEPVLGGVLVVRYARPTRPRCLPHHVGSMKSAGADGAAGAVLCCGRKVMIDDRRASHPRLSWDFVSFSCVHSNR